MVISAVAFMVVMGAVVCCVLCAVCDVLLLVQVGTPYYLSPEVLQSVPYDDRSDAWSLGCLLFELLAGRRPFEGENIAALVFNVRTFTSRLGQG